MAAEAIRIADGFTLVTGVGPKGYGNRIPARQLIENLQDHPQMMRTLELCKVYAVINGELFNKGRPLTLPEIEPMEGAEQPKISSVPEILKDPTSESRVSTTNDGSLSAGNLVL